MTGVCRRAAYVSGVLRRATSSCSEAPSEISVSSRSALEDPQRRSCQTCLERGVTELCSLIIASDGNPALPRRSGRACVLGRDVVSGGREDAEGGRMCGKDGAWHRGGPGLASSPRPAGPGPSAVLVAGEAEERGLVPVGSGVRVHLPAGQG